jgi:protocatechuate 3,4-dioxygenase beta subunit
MMAEPTARYSFRTLKPVAYPGRTPHIHLKVATADGRGSPASSTSRAIRRTSATSSIATRARDPAQRERIEMRSAANGARASRPVALATSMDIVIAR